LRDAEKAFTAALTHLDHPRLHHLLGLTYMQHGRTALGVSELEKAAMAFDPSLLHDRSWTRYWRDLANAYREIGRLDEALAAFDVAQFLSYPIPAYVKSCLRVARAYRSRGEVVHEIDVYKGTLRAISAWVKSGGSAAPLLRKVAEEVTASLEARGITQEESSALIRSLVESSPDLEEQLLRHVASFRKAREGNYRAASKGL
jgi:tetratricopeptide (TPR) repeat protein